MLIKGLFLALGGHSYPGYEMTDYLSRNQVDGHYMKSQMLSGSCCWAALSSFKAELLLFAATQGWKIC